MAEPESKTPKGAKGGTGHDEDFGEFAEAVVEQKVQAKITKTKSKKVAVSFADSEQKDGEAEGADTGKFARSYSKQGEIDESSISRNFFKMMRNSSQVMFKPGDSEEQRPVGSMGTRQGSSLFINRKEQRAVSKDKSGIQRGMFRGLSSRKELFEKMDAEVQEDGEIGMKPRRATDVPTTEGSIKEAPGTLLSPRLDDLSRKPSELATSSQNISKPPKQASKDAGASGLDEMKNAILDEEEASSGAFNRLQSQKSMKKNPSTKLPNSLSRRTSDPMESIGAYGRISPSLMEEGTIGSGKRSEAFHSIARKRQKNTSEPLLILVGIGRQWSKDLLGIGHNAIREEFHEAYYLLSLLRSMFADLSMEDVEMFFDFWDVTQDFIQAFFTIEEEVIYKDLAKIITIGGNLERNRRTNNKSHIMRTMQMLKTYFANELIYYPPAQAIDRLKEKVDKIAGATLRYMNECYSTLPMLVDQYLGTDVKLGDEMQQAMVDGIVGTGSSMNIHIYFHWIRDAVWSRYVTKKYIQKKHKKFWANTRKEFEDYHCQISKDLQTRCRDVFLGKVAQSEAEMIPGFWREEMQKQFEEQGGFGPVDEGALEDDEDLGIAAVQGGGAKGEDPKSPKSKKEGKDGKEREVMIKAKRTDENKAGTSKEDQNKKERERQSEKKEEKVESEPAGFADIRARFAARADDD
eukprot:CAMPEP_0184708220 /NCGR_PEP_ID=MMETSP0313-20130426/37664_1 /TAXON_ID=2792 /ORGANISM="Porphyridium aerugineum, Strain SAG 1380-2" /LENGTH=688 /DNA_ID=CAMNT_0027169803 /DNA_START=594 /DNA_END=2660 /DNA_ORIENTATION=+